MLCDDAQGPLTAGASAECRCWTNEWTLFLARPSSTRHSLPSVTQACACGLHTQSHNHHRIPFDYCPCSHQGHDPASSAGQRCFHKCVNSSRFTQTRPPALAREPGLHSCWKALLPQVPGGRPSAPGRASPAWAQPCRPPAERPVHAVRCRNTEAGSFEQATSNIKAVVSRVGDAAITSPTVTKAAIAWIEAAGATAVADGWRTESPNEASHAASSSLHHVPVS